jgi:putative transposase
MPRPKRIHYEGAIYHVTSRGNERRKIVVNDADRWQFLKVLAEVIEEEKVACHAWVLMDNHYHLLLETPAGNLSGAMKHLNGIYTQRFNRKHHRIGHLFQGRFKAIVVEKEAYLKELCRYLVLNPVRAKMVEKPEQWKWSSYRATAGLAKKEPWLETDWLLGQFGKSRKRAIEDYREFVNQGIKKKESPWEELRSRVYLGTQEFLNQAQRLGKAHDNLDIPKYQKQVVRQDPDETLDRVAREYGVKSTEILKSGRRNEARDAAIYLLKKECGLSLKQIGQKMGVGFSAVGNQWAKIKARVERDKRFVQSLEKCRM